MEQEAYCYSPKNKGFLLTDSKKDARVSQKVGDDDVEKATLAMVEEERDITAMDMLDIEMNS